MTAQQPTIIYTLTDEAPLLATYAFLPIVRTFAGEAGINIKTSDISLAARILAEFPDYLTEAQRVPEILAELGRLTQLPDTNIIKLPTWRSTLPPPSRRHCATHSRTPFWPWTISTWSASPTTRSPHQGAPVTWHLRDLRRRNRDIE
jgi:hypothetical protein